MTNHTSTDRADVYAIVTEAIVEALEAGTVPWRQPWDASIGRPVSLSTGKAYRGVNVLLLGLSATVNGYSSPYWGTYKQITERGGQVRKGEHGTTITFWKKISKKDEETGEEKSWMMLRYFKVFNSEQADPAEGKTFRLPKMAEREAFVPVEEAEMIFAGYFGREGAPRLVEAQDGAAWYSNSIDTVNLPPRSAFVDSEAFYSVAFHEAGHSTGHASRLNREGVTIAHRFGTPSYAAEELVAEITAAYVCGHAGIANVTVPASASYLANWLKALRNDPKMLVRAAGQAQKACDLILGETGEEAVETS